jgi:uncharacterized protein (TIGR00255 family)
MIQSMTGFGSGRQETSLAVCVVDVKTVNHKHLDLHVRLPGEFQSLEPTVRKCVTRRLRRGRVDVSVGVERVRKGVRVEADPDIVSSYVEAVKSLQRQFPITGELTVDAISRVPGAISISGADLSDEDEQALRQQVEVAVDQALTRLIEMRRTEGEALVRDLAGRIKCIRENLTRIRDGADLLVTHYRERLEARLRELAPSIEVDSNRLEVESLIYADKSDITEEITRLNSHLDQFETTMRADGEAGKRLDFLLQEMNREVTTILSKTSGLNASGAAIGEAAVNNKVEIDKLREQVQNVE